MQDNIVSIRKRIAAAVKMAGRQPQEITLVAVSKKQPAEKIREYCKFLHQQSETPILGENYVQEFRDKKEQFEQPFEAHLIGPLQSNKVRLAVGLFDVIQSVHSMKIAELINKEAAKTGKVQKVFLQVNISDDDNKAGFAAEDINQNLFVRLKALSNISVLGLMTITEDYDDKELVRADFRRLKQLSLPFEQSFNLPKCHLSMGMSDDFEIAIEEGATYVRIGSALFGERQI